MKKGILLFLASIMILGCASNPGRKSYSAIAKANSFDHYFPSASGELYFDTLDEAYDFINESYEKIKVASNKTPQKGMVATLDGPRVNNQKPVTVLRLMVASTASEGIDLSKPNELLESTLKKAVSVSLIFMVFYEDRGISISKFHLDSGYIYTDNTQYKSLPYKNNRYDATYPVGWSLSRAFSYLRKEID